jgi:DNA-directed DNA polymerase III PolC
MTKKLPNFPSPHTHLQSLDTGSTIEEFIKREKELETGTITCTDHGYLGACRDVYKLAKDNKLRPIIGIEGYHRDDGCLILQNHGFKPNAKGTYSDFYKYGHITLHAQDQAAYEKLIKVVSDRDISAEAHGSERKPIFTWADLEEIGSHNVTMTSGCLIGIVGRHVMDGRIEVAIDYYKKLRALAKPGNFYVELFTHKCDKNWVSGVFITLENGEKLKFYSGKKVKTDKHAEIAVADLAKLVTKGKSRFKLIAVKNRNTWSDLPVALDIVSCEQIHDFIANDCTPSCPDGDLQLTLNKFLSKMASMYGDKILISDDAHYAYRAEKVIQEAKLAGMGDGFRFYGDYHRYSSEEAFKHFSETMGMSEYEFETILNNNLEWASKFDNFKLENKISLPTKFYPTNTIEHLHALIKKHGRMNWNDPAMVARLESEIDLLYKNGTVDLLPYFFLGEEVVDLYEKAGLLTGPGRGSAAGMLIAYLLSITHVNPLEYDLSQDRFITIDRIKTGKMPDIDQDLPDREILLPWLKQRFGDHFSQVSTNTLLRLKSSILDVARAHWGHVPEEIHALTKSIPNAPVGVEDIKFIFGYKGDDEKEVRGLLYEHKPLQEYAAKYPAQWAIVQKMLGIVRGKSRHASAYIIANKPIDSFIPVMTVSDTRVTQYTAKSCEDAGALKMDYLCLNTLKDLSQVIKLIQDRSGLKFDKDIYINGERVPPIRQIPHNGQIYNVFRLPPDQAVFRTICEGSTETVFQLNTNSAKKWLQEFNYWKDEEEGRKSIDSIEAISAFTALDRPGPLDAEVKSTDGRKRNMLEEYAARARGERAYDAIDFMNKQLPETNGVMVYQEQLQNIFQKLTDCTGIEANNFRNDISKKFLPKVKERYPIFMAKAPQKVSEEEAQKIWDQTVTFGQYGFNKSHSVCYALTAYICAYFKYHFPLEWWCAVLRNAVDKDKNEVSQKFWKYCKDMVQLPDISYSKSLFTIKDDKIIAPLNLLQGVGSGAHEELSLNGPYTDIYDFCDKIAATKNRKSRTDPVTGKLRAGTSALNRGVVSKLIVSGVMDSLFPQGLNVISKLEMFEEALAKSLNKKRPEKIKEEYRNLSAIQIFQHKKTILPIYSEDLTPYLFNQKIEGISKKQVNIEGEEVTRYSYKPNDLKTIEYICKSMEVPAMNGALAFVDGPFLKYLNEDVIIDSDAPIHVAVAAFVVDVRKFSYRDKRSNKMLTALEAVLDIDGEIIRTVKWPTKKGKELIIPDGELKGSVCLCLMSRWNQKYGFSLDAVIKCNDPLGEQNGNDE